MGINRGHTQFCVCRVIDVGSEWRTFSNEKSSADRSRVGAAEVSIFLPCVPHPLMCPSPSVVGCRTSSLKERICPLTLAQ